jgi:phospholipase/carboxylesterase
MTFKFFTHKPSGLKKAEFLFIFIHGYGSNGQDLISLAPDLEEVLPNCVFISPNAPFPFEGGMYNAYQWYSLVNRDDEVLYQAGDISSKILNQFIDEQLQIHQVPEENLFILGFSQGGMMTLHTMLRRQKPARGIISCSGYISGAKHLYKDIKSKSSVLLTHGAVDEVVPFSALANAERVLKSLEVDVTTHTSQNLGHGIDFSCIKKIKTFIQSKI